jgi:putative hydrolase of the HAD superfamily
MHETKIRALILDYGGVISKPQDSKNVHNILEILKRDYKDFRVVYQNKREHYDSGHISAEEYWLSILQHYNLEQKSPEITNLIQEDVKSWTQINETMIQFVQESRSQVYKLAIISNMERNTLAFVRTHFEWLELFDELIFSCEVGKNKPDRRIYEACLDRLKLAPHECLFVDDFIENIKGAMKLGMNTIHFKSFPEFLKELSEKFCLTNESC